MSSPSSTAAPGTPSTVREDIRDYYGRVLSSSDDLKTGACCSTDPPDPRVRTLLDKLHPEVRQRFYGCGIPLPQALEGATVLDLGCGAGRDCYLLSALVGPRGRVIGVDMTSEQLEVARRHRDFHARAFGHARSNVEFHLGYMEELGPLGIEDASVDVVVSNCVFNLSPDKSGLFREVFRVLRPGGELH
ncbi:MAG: methyltransferase domain-containing protein, partial [Gemmatimonadales bacterium]